MRSIGAVTAFVFLSLAARSIVLTAQAPTLEPRRSFEVASVRVDNSQTRTPMQWQAGGHYVGSLPVLSLVSMGYLVPAYTIEGLPDWARAVRFLINARANSQPDIEERPAYYRGLLVDRFKLAAHIEKRDMDVYTLTLARNDGKLGPGLRRSDVNCDQAIAESRKRNLAGGRVAPAPGVRPMCGAVGGVASLTGGAVELAPLIGMLAQALGRPVLDKTGLTGRFDINFQAAPPNGVRDGSALAALPPVFTAVDDQLGLKLVAGRAPVEVLVIDRLEMPTED